MITANTQSDFYTSTFTAYTSVNGVTATFTVNFKYVRKNTSQVMWETFQEAVIRSITGNGLNKSLSYSMTILNSYDSQGNLTASQVATIQSLTGRNDGKTYTVNYTTTIWVYTPAEYSGTGQKEILRTFDGNSSSDIATCLSRWGWNNNSKLAIQQAASSLLTLKIDNSLTVTMKATRNSGTVFDTRSKSVICPKGDTNLVWFTVYIPETGYSSADVTFTFTVTTPATITWLLH